MFDLKQDLYLFWTLVISPKQAGLHLCKAQSRNSKPDPTSSAHRSACSQDAGGTQNMNTRHLKLSCAALSRWMEHQKQKAATYQFYLHRNVSCHKIPLHCVHTTGKSCHSFINNSSQHYSVIAH